MKKLLIAFFCLLMFPMMACAEEIPDLNKAGLDQLIEKNHGKVILINFFATWCPPCKMEVPQLVSLRNAYPADKLLLIGLSVDETAAPLPAFLKETGVNYPVYMAARDITDAYNVSSVPHLAFIAPNGQMIMSEPGLADISALKQVTDDLLRMK